MSRIGLENLIAIDAGRKDVWESLWSWLVSHPSTRFIDVRRLAREIKKPTTVELAEAMNLLVKNGVLRRVYRVETPAGDLLDKDYDSPSSIPADLFDRFEKNSFPKVEAEIVSGYQLEASI